MELTFVQQYNGETPKKRRLAKACDACRARKKRCHHHPIDEGVDDQVEEVVDNGTRDSPAFHGISVRKGDSHRFMSDLNPETRLLERTTATGENNLAKSMDSVGIWVNKTEYESMLRQRDAAKGGGPKVNETQQGSFQLTSRQIDGLVDVYFEKIHPFLPLLEEIDFRRAKSEGTLPEALLHAVCLVAAKDSDATQHLASVSDTQMSPRSFCRNLYASLKRSIPHVSKQDKLTLICLLALVSLHTEGSDGCEDASIYLVQAMRYCQMQGLHLSSSFPARNGKHTKRLFWCLWILDRFSSAMNGTPLIMANIDLAIEHFGPGESEFPAFEILLKIAGVLDDVIDFYRPGNPPTTTGWEERFPGFEEIVESVQGWSLPAGLLSTLHVVYLSVAILSHRSKGTADFASTTPSYVRQCAAASSIIRLMSPARLPTLHASPILPYAISLALSVSYQHLRQDQLLHQQEDARADFEACFVILRELRKTWSSADAMSTLSEKVVDELQRVSNLSSFRVKRQPPHDKELSDFTSACKHNGEAVVLPQNTQLARGLATNNNESVPTQGVLQLDVPSITSEETTTNMPLFAGIDDIFGTYLDPNYPVNLDFLDDLHNFDATEWSPSK